MTTEKPGLPLGHAYRQDPWNYERDYCVFIMPSGLDCQRKEAPHLPAEASGAPDEAEDLREESWPTPVLRQPAPPVPDPKPTCCGAVAGMGHAPWCFLAGARSAAQPAPQEEKADGDGRESQE